MTVSTLFSPISNPAAADCGTPPAAHVNGNPPVYSNTISGSTVIYTCQPGYMRIGDRTITCLGNGQWNASAPDCDRELPLAAGSISPILHVKENPDSVMPEHNFKYYK